MTTAVSQERLDRIAEEVFDLMGYDDVFDFLNGAVQTHSAMEKRLQEIMMGRQAFECLELAMYLRCCFSQQEMLPTWNPLLNAAIEMCMMRKEDLVMFYGLMPSSETYDRNTTGMNGNKHPQLRQK